MKGSKLQALTLVHLRVFLAKQSAENNFQEGAASSPHGIIMCIIMSSGDTSQSKQPSSRC